MSFRTGLLAAVEAARSISGPSGLDIRVNQVTIRTRTWSGSQLREGTATDEDLVLPAHYPVRSISTREVSDSAGEYEVGDVSVSHITPSDGSGTGYTPEQLKPAVTEDNIETVYILTGTHAGEYKCVACETFRPFSYRLVLRRRA